jgi:hypothetical protein
MTGVVGLIADRRIRRSRLRLVLNVTMLGRGAEVNIDAADVELVSAPTNSAVAGPGRRHRGGYCGGPRLDNDGGKRPTEAI